jgi:hypothetical protein
MRVRFSIDSAKWTDALAYAEATNRSPSELICEALDQIQARYPKRRHATETSLIELAVKVADILGLQVPAGTFTGKDRVAS